MPAEDAYLALQNAVVNVNEVERLVREENASLTVTDRLLVSIAYGIISISAANMEHSLEGEADPEAQVFTTEELEIVKRFAEHVGPDGLSQIFD